MRNPGLEVFVRPSLLQAPEGGGTRCNVCERRCVISPGGQGWCRTRENRGGSLVTLIYGAVSSLAPNPIEKKPFYHYLPGASVLTAGSFSCNFDCPWCQNYEISKTHAPEWGEYVSPEDFVAAARRHGCRGVSISFNEPTLSLEWSLDVFRLARARGLCNTFVTNGYMTPEALDLLVEAGLDAMNVDVKGDAEAVRRYCRGVELERIWGACARARARGVWIEITTLVIPTVNDSDQALRGIAGRIVADLGRDTPWHVSGYHPAHRFTAPRTPLAALERAWDIGRAAGLRYVYVGNRPGHSRDHTQCPGCGATLIERAGFDVRRNVVYNGRCPHCDQTIAGVWQQE
jgi:pyruvate formate lyase activating enzyme